MECGGKRSATPLWLERLEIDSAQTQAKAASRFACRRTPYGCGRTFDRTLPILHRPYHARSTVETKRVSLIIGALSCLYSARSKEGYAESLGRGARSTRV